ncbi:MAG TPA: hypothetical protein VK083_18745 [Nocardia sp.]|nr:hypothetical protein [Nocardia sp.]HLS78822.1 hypothetical protein [Nocardia sp.]
MPETLDRVVDTVRTVVDDHLQDRDVFAWRFTLPVAEDDPAHLLLAAQWRLEHPGQRPDGRGTYEIALSLVGAPDDLTEPDLAALRARLLSETACLESAPAGCLESAPAGGGSGLPRTITVRRRDSFDYEFEREIL